MIDGERGYYWVRSIVTDAETHEVLHYGLWGGSKDPNGKRRGRYVKPDQIKPDKRDIERVLYPEWAK